MALSMRALLSVSADLPEEVRTAIANRDPASAGHLMLLGLNPCEAAELLDEPCTDEERVRTFDDAFGCCEC